MKNARCWARKFDNCSSKLSGEHTISVNAWPGSNRAEKEKTRIVFRRGNLRADGTLDTNVPGGFDRPMTVNTLKAKVLCVDHNSQLWETDHESGELTASIHAFWDMYMNKRTIPGLRYTRKVYEVDGPLIERWFLKTVLANTVRDGVPIGALDAEDGTPTDDLVDIAFGLRLPFGHIGLYGAAAVNRNLVERGDFSFMPWSWFDRREPNRSYIAGALCEYRGLRFVLNLDRDIPPPVAQLRRLPGWGEIQLLNPLKTIEAPDANLFFHFAWPETALAAKLGVPNLPMRPAW